MLDSATGLQMKNSAIINHHRQIDDSQVRNSQSMLFEELQHENVVENS
jgi:hypothetical protein